jgi:hypothetical protein
MEVPSLVEVIGKHGFFGCTSLSEVIFSSDSHLREISGFQLCSSLYQIEIPSSVEVIGYCGFFSCESLRVVIFWAGCRLRESERLRWKRILIQYESEDLKEHRRVVHLGIVWKESEEGKTNKRQTQMDNETKAEIQNSGTQFSPFREM